MKNFIDSLGTGASALIERGGDLFQLQLQGFDALARTSGEVLDAQADWAVACADHFDSFFSDAAEESATELYDLQAELGERLTDSGLTFMTRIFESGVGLALTQVKLSESLMNAEAATRDATAAA